MAKELNRQDKPLLTRGDVAKILNCSPLTMANREATGKYPAPTRAANGYRTYTLEAVFELQIITYGRIAVAPIITVVYDRGWTDVVFLNLEVEKALNNTQKMVAERSYTPRITQEQTGE